MVFYFTAFGLLVHVLLWGIGPALTITPRRWLAFWPVFAVLYGVALQSAVVWAGAHTTWAGTDDYGRWSELLPIAWLGLGLRRLPAGRRTRFFRDLAKFWPLALVMIAALSCLIYPSALASPTLTTSSLGSCDAADYAAGARVLKEFSRLDRSGFMGLSEVVRIASVDNFFDYWIRLNHFTPSAVVALNGAVFGLQPYQVVGLSGGIFLLAGVPIVFWLARAGFRYGRIASLFVAALYAFSPLTWYAFSHVALSQLLAGPAITLLTWCGMMLWRGRLNGRAALAWTGALATAYWLLLGSYNFIIVVCLVPAIAYAGGLALWQGQIPRFFKWLALILAPLVPVGLLSAQRVLGLVERFRLLRQIDFGWRIPALTPEGWLGIVADTSLTPVSSPLRWIAVALAVGGAGFAFSRGLRWGKRNVYLAAAWSLPILIGYTYLVIRGEILNTNASYDAYKLLSVFYPGLLCAICYWISLDGTEGRWHRLIVVAAGTAVLGLNIQGGQRFIKRLKSPPLMVGTSLAHLQLLERDPEISGINMLVSEPWSRLWANSFLLRKPQYFLEHTYEARKNTALRGEWDLLGGVLTIQIDAAGSAEKSSAVERPYSLLDRKSPAYLRVEFGQGWYGEERTPRKGRRWRWTKGSAALQIENPHPYPLTAALRCVLQSPRPRDLQLTLAGRVLRTAQVGDQPSEITVSEMVLPPGRTVLELNTSVPAFVPAAGDPRALAFMVHSVAVEVKALAPHEMP
jgi:hypothetical protein